MGIADRIKDWFKPRRESTVRTEAMERRAQARRNTDEVTGMSIDSSPAQIVPGFGPAFYDDYAAPEHGGGKTNMVEPMAPGYEDGYDAGLPASDSTPAPPPDPGSSNGSSDGNSASSTF